MIASKLRLCLIDTPFVALGSHLMQNAFRHHGKLMVWGSLECLWIIEWGITRYQIAQQQERAK